MRSEFDLLQTVLQKGFPILVSFLDDALILGLTKLGISLPWLQCLSAILLTATLIYWSWRILHFLHKQYLAHYA